MTQPNDGGPAFPCEGGDFSGLHPAYGITLRDYFAARAPLIPKEVIRRDPLIKGVGHFQCLNEQQQQAWWAYKYADAMIAARTPTNNR